MWPTVPCLKEPGGLKKSSGKDKHTDFIIWSKSALSTDVSEHSMGTKDEELSQTVRQKGHFQDGTTSAETTGQVG